MAKIYLLLTFSVLVKYMKDFKCPKCGGSTQKVWENETKTRYGMRCKEGHKSTSNKSVDTKEYPVILVSSEELE